jgi:hypothetical protein
MKAQMWQTNRTIALTYQLAPNFGNHADGEYPTEAGAGNGIMHGSASLSEVSPLLACKNDWVWRRIVSFSL